MVILLNESKLVERQERRFSEVWFRVFFLEYIVYTDLDSVEILSFPNLTLML